MGLGSAVPTGAEPGPRGNPRTYNGPVAEVEPTVVSGEEQEGEPPLDPGAVERAYRAHRARRVARDRWQRERRWAGVRFWLVLVLALAAAVLLASRTLGEIERVFGL
jgi:hypothetical protein